MEPITIVLKTPVEIVATNGTKSMLTEVTVRSAKAKDLKFIPDSAFAENPKVAAIAAYCGLQFEVAEEIDFMDVVEILKAMADFMPAKSGTIGEKSSGESPESITSLP